LLILITAAILSFMIFFPVVVATSVFKVLDEKQSSKFLRIFFPKYYLFGLVLSLTGLIIAIFDKNNMSLIIFLLIIIGFLFSRQFLMPIINKAKDNNNEKKFNILHRFSVLINFIQISLCVFLLIIFLK
jgi:putative copper export protein